jgi:glucokinase
VRALAIDLGGSHANCALVEGPRILAKRRIAARGSADLGSLLPAIQASADALLGECGLASSDCAGAVLGFCGLVDTDTGKILSTNAKYDDAPRLDLVEWSRRTLDLPLRVENDARLALLGEWYAGAARGCADLVMVTLGTGVGGAAMMGGRLLRGKHYQAGCLGGHLPVAYNGRRCSCGSFGCTEAEASGVVIEDVCREWPQFEDSPLAREPVLDFSALFRIAAQGDAVANQIVDRCIHIWAAGTIGLIHAYDPEMVIFGGGVMNSGGRILPGIECYVHAHAWTPWGEPRIRAAELGSDAALLGACPLLEELPT